MPLALQVHVAGPVQNPPKVKRGSRGRKVLQIAVRHQRCTRCNDIVWSAALKTKPYAAGAFIEDGPGGVREVKQDGPHCEVVS